MGTRKSSLRCASHTGITCVTRITCIILFARHLVIGIAYISLMKLGALHIE